MVATDFSSLHLKYIMYSYLNDINHKSFLSDRYNKLIVQLNEAWQSYNRNVEVGIAQRKLREADVARQQAEVAQQDSERARQRAEAELIQKIKKKKGCVIS